MRTKKLLLTILVIGGLFGGVLLFAGGAQEEGEAPAAEAVKVIRLGAIYPLTGSAAREGQESKAVLDLAMEVINNPTNLQGIPLAESAGLPNLGGAKIELVYGDHQGKPEIGRAETERLITVENVVAMLGSYHSSVTLVATPVADRYGIPFLVPDSTNPDITKQGLTNVFRTTPINDVYVRDAVDMVVDFQKQQGTNYKRVAISHDTSVQGKNFHDLLVEALEKAGFDLIGAVGTKQGSTDVTADVLKLKSMDPEILFTHHYTAEAILFQEAFKKYQFEPKAVVTVSNAYGLPDFISGAGEEANYVFVPGTFPPKFIGTQPVTKQVNDMFRQKHGRDMGDGRAFVGLIVLAEAINRAGSTDADAIIKALQQTRFDENQIIMPWKGVEFGPTGENELASITFQQVLNEQFEIVWPFRLQTAEGVWPAPAFEDR